MNKRSRSERLPYFVPAVLGALLLGLGTLQYRWVGEVARAERDRLRSSLRAGAERLADDFDRELSRALLHFLPEPFEGEQGAAALAARWAAWTELAPYPGLIGELLLAEPGPDATSALRRFDPDDGELSSIEWPEDFEPLRRSLDRDERRPRTLADAAALIVPTRSRGPRRRTETARSVLVLRIDTDYIARKLVPELIERHLRIDDETTSLARLVSSGDSARVFYRSEGAPTVGPSTPPDVSVPIFAVRPFPELHGWGQGWRELFHPPARRRIAPRRPTDAGAWVLEVTHPAGSLEAAVGAFRRRNLSVGLGILGLLGATIVAMIVAVRRAQRLARQQLEFVAAVSHELHTPLAAIRTAGQNLADGVVAEPSRVRRYGTMIETEGRRLSGMVANVLEYAGIRSGRKAYAMHPLSPAEVVREALEDARWTLERYSFEVRLSIEETPDVVGDAGALRQAVHNLVENAIKYGAGARWLSVRTAVDDDGRSVRIDVVDRGPGVSAEDVPHLFEPFYRGKGPQSGTVRGSGLGLSLVKGIVEAHGGSVELVPEGTGSCFRVRLPIARGEESPVAQVASGAEAREVGS